MGNTDINKEVNGWRILVENTKDIMDPSEVEYSFVFFKDGFCHDAKDQIKKKLQDQIEVLDKPFIKEYFKKWLKEE